MNTTPLIEWSKTIVNKLIEEVGNIR